MHYGECGLKRDGPVIDALKLNGNDSIEVLDLRFAIEFRLNHQIKRCHILIINDILVFIIGVELNGSRLSGHTVIKLG